MKAEETDPNDDALRVTCSLCGRSFVAGPDDFWEAGFTAKFARDEEIARATAAGEELITPDGLAAMSEYELGEIGLTPATRDELLNAECGTDITSGGAAICPACAEEHGEAMTGKEADRG